jgi:hypothetical protein
LKRLHLKLFFSHLFTRVQKQVLCGKLVERRAHGNRDHKGGGAGVTSQHSYYPEKTTNSQKGVRLKYSIGVFFVIVMEQIIGVLHGFQHLISVMTFLQLGSLMKFVTGSGARLYPHLNKTLFVGTWLSVWLFGNRSAKLCLLTLATSLKAAWFEEYGGLSFH